MLRSKRYIAALMAFLLWGGWAVFVNSKGGWDKALVAGVVQGSASAILTLIMATAVVWQAQMLANPLFKALLPPVVTVAMTGTLLYAAHAICGTAHPSRTMLLPMTVAFFYCLSLTVPVARRIKDPLSLP